MKAIENLQSILGAKEAALVLLSAKTQERLEATWRRKMKQKISQITEELLANAEKTNRLSFDAVDFRSIVMEQSYEVILSSIKGTQRYPVLPSKLAAPPASALPKSLRALRLMWDQWNTRKKLPPRQKL